MSDALIIRNPKIVSVYRLVYAALLSSLIAGIFSGGAILVIFITLPVHFLIFAVEIVAYVKISRELPRLCVTAANWLIGIFIYGGIVSAVPGSRESPVLLLVPVYVALLLVLFHIFKLLKARVLVISLVVVIAAMIVFSLWAHFSSPSSIRQRVTEELTKFQDTASIENYCLNPPSSFLSTSSDFDLDDCFSAAARVVAKKNMPRAELIDFCTRVNARTGRGPWCIFAIMDITKDISLCDAFTKEFVRESAVHTGMSPTAALQNLRNDCSYHVYTINDAKKRK